MKTTELIEILEQLIADHKISGAEQVMGPHEIYMDLFQHSSTDADPAHHWRYRGVTGNLGISYTDDGVFCMLGPVETWT